jgi:large repetitive protein
MSHAMVTARPLGRGRRSRLRATCATVLLATVLAGLGSSVASAAGWAAPATAETMAEEYVFQAPTNLTANVYPNGGAGSGQVRLDWTAPPAIRKQDGNSTFEGTTTDYAIEWSVDGVTWTRVDDGRISTTGHIVGGLTIGTTYTFRVMGWVWSQPTWTSPWSQTVKARPPGVPPAAPDGLTATVAPTPGVAPGDVQLSWTKPVDDGGAAVTDYVIERSADGTSWTTISDGMSTTTSYTVSGLGNGATYSFRVKSTNAIGTGDPTDPVTATTPTAPKAPSGLAATVAPADGVAPGAVKLSWTAPADDGGAPVTDYRIERFVLAGTWVTVDDGVSTATSSIVSGLTGGGRYSFRVRAENVVGEGQVSAVTSATALDTPAAPTKVTATGYPTVKTLAGAVKLAWFPPTSNGGKTITDYAVQSSIDGVTWTTIDDGVSPTIGFTVTGLTNGTKYSFRIAAVNAVGTGPWSELITATPLAPAGAPGGMTATVAPTGGVGSGQVKLSWTAPVDDGGAPIVDYTISYASAGQTWVVVDDGVSTATTATVSGLGNGLEYAFSVVAKTSAGNGQMPVVTATPVGAPTVAPTGLTATVAPTPGVGPGDVKLTWTAATPKVSAAPYTDYLIQYSPDGTTWTTAHDGVSLETSFTIGELTNGTNYEFRIATVNQLGASPFSGTVQATPVWMPSAPDVTTATAPTNGVGSGEVELAWDAPADNGLAITDYVIELSTDGDSWTTVDDGVSTATTFTFSGLTNGTEYGFRVAAVNSLGQGQPSVSTSATPVWTPTAPDLTATVAPADGIGSGQVRLSWTARQSNGSEITDYLIESSTDGQTWTAVDDGVSGDPTYMVDGLTNGTAYQYRVTAINAVGIGAPSADVTATPVWVPAAPDGLTAALAPATGVSSGQVKLTWTTPIDNGSTITDYIIESSTDGQTWTAVDDGMSPAATATVRGLSNGTNYQFRVAAVNAVGQGASSTTIPATPRWKPTAPRGLRASSPGSRRVRLIWNAPSSSNGAAITDYVIQRANGSRWTTVRDGVSTTRSATITRLTNGTAYRFRVAAKNAVGVGPWSTIVRATPNAP